MHESLKQVKNRIRSIQSTKKVTNAMQMISVAKLNNADKALKSVRLYLAGLEPLLVNLVNSRKGITNPFFLQPEAQDKPIALCVVTSDTGLCGLYNQNVLFQAEHFIQKQKEGSIRLILLGKKGIKHFKAAKLKILHTYAGLNGIYSPIVSDEIAGILAKLFLSGEVAAVYIASAYLKNAFIQSAGVRKFLNIEIPDAPPRDYIIEHPFDELLAKVTMKYIIARMRLVLLEAFSSEHAARSLAMKSATDNAGELVEKLILIRNKIRQANITQDMMEIISSAEALRG